jgi:soluble lytic murein transglycosylase
MNFVHAKLSYYEKNADHWIRFSIREAIQRRVKRHAQPIFSALMREGARFDFDPVLLMAMIEVESGFKVNRRGSHGEIGLMQLKPSTARWIARKYNLPWSGAKTLENPAANIQLGTAYLSHLRNEFLSNQQLYLSAYNMGSAKVRKVLRKRQIPDQYASRVARQYEKFQPKLVYAIQSI